jgi:polyisoprenoid-binding protein YceI
MNNGNWKVDTAHSSVSFTINHLVVAKIRGTFKAWSADLSIDEADMTRASVAVKIEAASIDTGSEQRDAHLRSADFFDAEKHPALTFQSKRVERTGSDAFRVVGDLTIRDVTKEVALDMVLGGFVTDPWGGRRAGFTATTSIERSAFGIVWNQVLEGGGVFVGDRVEIGIEVEAVSKAEANAA